VLRVNEDLIMAKKTPAVEESPESILVTAAKTLGTVAGKVAAVAGAHAETPAAPKKVKIPKLAPRNKARLPRREKKALKKAEAKKG
jgi:hypothetical protein